MPELPEVESSRAIIEIYCLNQTIVRVETKEQGGGPREGIFDDLVYENDLNGAGDKEKLFLATVLKKKLTAVKRRGKYFWFEFDKSSSVVIFHFGMTGSMIFKDLEAPQYKSFKRKNDEWPPKFTKLLLEFSNGQQLAFSDTRRLGRIKLRTNHLTVPPLSSLGLDPVLDPLPSAPELSALLSKLSSPIKAVLLDQEKIFCGLGNWMIDEILYQSGIHPASPAQSLSAACVARILSSMQYIISTAIECNNAFQPFPSHWLFHYRWDKGKTASSKDKKEPVNRMPDGSAISHDTQGGRTSAVVLSKQVKYSGHGGKKSNDKKVLTDAEDQNVAVSGAAVVQTSGRKRKNESVVEEESTETSLLSEVRRGKRGRPARGDSGLAGSESVDSLPTKKGTRRGGGGSVKEVKGPTIEKTTKRKKNNDADEVEAVPEKRKRGSAVV